MGVISENFGVLESLLIFSLAKAQSRKEFHRFFVFTYLN
jgi:hypothetical protein